MNFSRPILGLFWKALNRQNRPGLGAEWEKRHQWTLSEIWGGQKQQSLQLVSAFVKRWLKKDLKSA